MPNFAPDEAKTAVAPITVMPSGLNCEAEIFLGPDDMTKVATSGRVGFISTSAQQSVYLPIAMPSEEGAYHVYIDVYAEGFLIAAYQAVEDVTIGRVWLSPTGWLNDPTVDPIFHWWNGEYAYDGVENMYATTRNIPFCVSTGWLELTHDAIPCDGVAISVFTYARYDEWIVDVFYDGAWHNILQSMDVPDHTWYEIPLGGTFTVTAMRVKHHGMRYGYLRPTRLYEAAFSQGY